MPIDFYSSGQPYDIFSNVEDVEVRINIGGKLYHARASEAIFQGVKGLGSRNPTTRAAAENLIQTRTISGAGLQIAGQSPKKPGGTIDLAPDELYYDNRFRGGTTFVKEQLMYELLLAKATQNPEILKALLATGNEPITERTSGRRDYNDNFWGDGWDGTGRNALGRIWMSVRDRLRDELRLEGAVRVRIGFSDELSDSLHIPRGRQLDDVIITQASLDRVPPITTVSEFHSVVRYRPPDLFTSLKTAAATAAAPAPATTTAATATATKVTSAAVELPSPSSPYKTAMDVLGRWGISGIDMETRDGVVFMKLQVPFGQSALLIAERLNKAGMEVGSALTSDNQGILLNPKRTAGFFSGLGIQTTFDAIKGEIERYKANIGAVTTTSRVAKTETAAETAAKIAAGAKKAAAAAAAPPPTVSAYKTAMDALGPRGVRNIERAQDKMTPGQFVMRVNFLDNNSARQFAQLAGGAPMEGNSVILGSKRAQLVFDALMIKTSADTVMQEIQNYNAKRDLFSTARTSAAKTTTAATAGSKVGVSERDFKSILSELEEAIGAGRDTGYSSSRPGSRSSSSDPFLTRSRSPSPTHHGDPNLVKVFQDTKKRAESGIGLDRKLTDSMIKGTVPFRSNRDGSIINPRDRSTLSPSSSRTYPTTFQIVATDSFVAAKQMMDAGGSRPLVLNMANATGVGGGAEYGSRAQEEDLFRCSNYYQALYPLGHAGDPSRKRGKEASEEAGRRYYDYPIAEFGSYYTPGVQVFRDSTKGYAEVTPFAVDCIAVAGYNLNKPNEYEDNLRDRNGRPLQGQALKDAFVHFTKVKIRHILDVALRTGHDSVVLGPISCGAFRLTGDNRGETAALVARAYQDVFQEPAYQNRFRNVTFAVLPTPGVGVENHRVFDGLVKDLSSDQRARHRPS